MAVINGTPAHVINNAVQFATSKLDVGGKHFEVNTVENMFGKNAINSSYLGMMRLWSDRKELQAPLISDTVLQGNVMYVAGLGAQLGFSRPYEFDLPFIRENVNANIQRVGLGESKFKLVLSGNNYVTGDVLILKDMYKGPQVRIVYEDEEDEIVPYGGSDSWIYSVKLFGRDLRDKWIPQHFLAAGTPVVKIDHPGGEFDFDRTSIETFGSGLAHYSMETANSDRGVETWLTRDAMGLKPMTANTDIKNLTFWRDINGSNAIMNLIPPTVDKDGEMVLRNGRPVYELKNLKWIPFALYRLKMELAKMQQRSLMFGQGGTFYDAGGKKTKAGVGYYHQLKSGNHLTYTNTRELISLIKNLFSELFDGSNVPIKDRVVRLKVGGAIDAELQKEFRADFQLNNPWLFLGRDVPGLLTGTNMDLKYNGYRFTSTYWDEVGTVIMEHDPALDNVSTGIPGTVSQSSMIGGKSLASWTVIIEDITSEVLSNRSAVKPNFDYEVGEAFNNGANVVMIKPEMFRNGPHLGFEIGMGAPDEFRAYAGVSGSKQVSTGKKGVGIFMDDASQIWIKDVTRTVIIEREDPLGMYFNNTI